MSKLQQGIALVDELTDDELNQLVDYIRVSYKTRRAQRNARAKAQMTVGTRVMLAGVRKPQYLSGLTGEVVEIRNTRVVIQLDRGPVGKFKNGKVVTDAGGVQIIANKED